MDLDAAHLQYDSENSFSSREQESLFLKARANYVEERTNFHLQNSNHADLDLLAVEEGHVDKFFAAAQKDLLEAAIILFHGGHSIAHRLANQDADDADYPKIMESL